MSKRVVWIPNSENHIPRPSEGFQNVSAVYGDDFLTEDQKSSGDYIRFVEENRK